MKRWVSIVLLIVASSSSALSSASDVLPFQMDYVPRASDYVLQEGQYPYEQCFVEAAEQYKQYGVEAVYLKAIAWQESNFNSDAFNDKNATPSEDHGIMQINSWWLDNHLHKWRINKEKLYDPCVNIFVGAWIFANELKTRNGLWEAVGYYNAKTESKRQRYIGNVKAAYQGILSGSVLASYWSKPNRATSTYLAYSSSTGLQQPSWDEVKGLLVKKEAPRLVRPKSLAFLVVE